MHNKTWRKKIFIVAACLLPLPALAQAQGADSTTVRTVSRHTLSLSSSAAVYGYEHPVLRRVTLEGQAGFRLPMGYATGFSLATLGYVGNGYRYGHTTADGFFVSVHPFVAASSRFYYSLDRRHRKGRRTAHNSANFIAISVQHTFRPIATVRAEGFGLTSVIPHWGVRRVYGDWFLLEFALGLDFNRNTHGHNDTDPYLNLRLGYVF